MRATLGALFGLAPAPRARLAGAAMLGALTVVFGAGLMAIAGYLISRAAERPAILSLMIAIVGVQFCGLGRPVARYTERLASHDVALRVLGGVRARFYELIVPLAPAQLAGYRQGDLLSRMVSDVDALQDLYLRGIQPPIVALLAGAATVGAACAVLPAAGLVLATGLIVAGIAVPAVGASLAGRARRRQAAARGRLSAELIEVLGGASELMAYGADHAAIERVRAADGALVSLARRDAFAAGAADGLGLLVSGLTAAGVLAVAAAASAHRGLDAVLIALLTLLALASFEAVTPLAAAARDLFATIAAGRRILQLTDQRPVVTDPAVPAAAPAWPFGVELSDVRARYPGAARPALDGLSLRLEPGEKVAMLGASGAGKTTVVNLLLRFLDPDEGQVTLGGQDLRGLRQDDVRSLLAVAGQESHLFSASIRDNVRLARPDASDEEIELALRRARLWGWVCRLPEGVDTWVGERGCELSGGQRQRLTVARALLADAPVLVLDEPTAHLDPGNAQALIEDVFAAAGSRTVLLITHRPEGLELVDRVISLDGTTAGPLS